MQKKPKTTQFYKKFEIFKILSYRNNVCICIVIVVYFYCTFIFLYKKINFVKIFLYIIGLPSIISCIEIIIVYFCYLFIILICKDAL